MKVKYDNCYLWQKTPIEIEIDADLARYFINSIERDVIECAKEGKFETVADLIIAGAELNYALKKYDEQLKKENKESKEPDGEDE